MCDVGSILPTSSGNERTGPMDLCKVCSFTLDGPLHAEAYRCQVFALNLGAGGVSFRCRQHGGDAPVTEDGCETIPATDWTPCHNGERCEACLATR